MMLKVGQLLSMDYLHTIVHNLPMQYTFPIAFVLYYLFVCLCVYICAHILLQ